MAKEKQALGKGLEVLFARTPEPEKPSGDTVTQKDAVLFVDVNSIHMNPYQPREEFDEASLKELTESIRQKGVIQAITIRKLEDGKLELIAGERRLRAARLAGLDKIPAYVLDVTSKEDLLEISLIENIQRKDLNPLEIANGYQRLVDECSLTQEQVAEKVGKSRSAVTNFLRLLKLPEEIKASIKKNEITEGHARAILSVENEAEQVLLWKRITGESLTVRRSEEIARKAKKPREKKIFVVNDQNKAAINFLEQKFREHFGTKVKIHPKSKSSGEIIIEYYTPEDLERIVDLCRKK